MKNIILLPTYNENENVKIIIPEIFNLIPDINIMVIDDSSPDGTASTVRKLMKNYPNLTLLERRTKEGLGAAYKEAFGLIRQNQAIKHVITMDADGSHDPRYLLGFLNKIKDYDLVVGSRYTPGGGIETWEVWRKYLSRFGNLYAKTLAGLPIKDVTAGYMCLTKNLVDKLNLDKISSAGYAFLIETKYQAVKILKARWIEIPIVFKTRRKGESKISSQIISEGVKTPFKIFFSRIVERPLYDNLVCNVCQRGNISNYTSKSGYNFYRCEECTLIFIHPIPHDLENIYKETYFYDNKTGNRKDGYVDYEKDKEGMKASFENFLDKASKLAKGRELYDVGTATGYFLDLALKKGWHTAGSEISLFAAQKAQNKGHRIQIGKLPEKAEQGVFDLVTMWDVLEHLSDPQTYIQISNKMLKAEGLLAINTPDAGSLMARFLGKYWHLYIPPEHLHYFSRKSLERLIETNGFKIVEFGRMKKSYSLPYIFKILHTCYNLKIFGKMANMIDNNYWRQFSFNINLGDNIYLLAKKVRDV